MGTQEREPEYAGAQETDPITTTHEPHIEGNPTWQELLKHPLHFIRLRLRATTPEERSFFTKLLAYVADPRTQAEWAEEERRLAEARHDPVVQELERQLNQPGLTERERGQIIDCILDREWQLMHPDSSPHGPLPETDLDRYNR